MERRKPLSRLARTCATFEANLLGKPVQQHNQSFLWMESRVQQNTNTNQHGDWLGGIALRWLMLLNVAILVSTQSGCQIFRRFGARPEPVPVVFNKTPTLDELLTKLNSNASAVRQLDANIKLSMAGMPKLKGKLQLERPNRIRMKAGVMGVAELGVDVGSNDELFWVWARASLPNQTPAIYYARHNQFQDSQMRAALPLEPQWLIDATGLVEFSPNETHQGPFPGPNGFLKLISTRQTAAGPMYRQTLIEPQSSRIYQQTIYDASGKRVAYSDSSEFRTYADGQVSLPHKIVLHVFGPDGTEAAVLNVTADDFRLNSLFGDPDRMWSMPGPEGVQMINLAEMSSQ